jgi:hypothetical protein
MTSTPKAWLADVLDRVNDQAIHKAGRALAVELGRRDGAS